MRLVDDVGVDQVGDGAGDAQNTVIGAAGPVEALHGPLQQPLGLLVQLAVVIDFARAQELVALALSLELQRGGCLHPGGDDGGRLTVRLFGEDGGIDRANFHLNVDAVEQWPGDAALVTQANVRCAAAADVPMAVVAARAWVHRGDQLKVRGKVRLPGGA